MCGVVGFLARNEARTDSADATLEAMAKSLAHRGPDASGIWSDWARGVGLGHRRLAVLGLGETGAQPMISQSGRWVLAYNGELYNFEALRTELEGRGATFRGQSDTEVLVEGLDYWGIRGLLDRSDGMFAFAVWDRSTQTLTLARDRFGEKPMYYGWMGATFLFASELRALRRHPAFSPEPDSAAIELLHTYGYVPAPLSIYRGIRKLPPGSILTIGPGQDRLEQWWDAAAVARSAASAPFSATPDEAAKELASLMGASVGSRLVADVPVGVLLSGGVDSSAVAAAAASSTGRVKTFSISFESDQFDEAPFARRVSGVLGTDHEELKLTDREAIELTEHLPNIWDDPFADSSQIPTYLVATLARRSVTVALTGDGGDELFGGYDRYRYLQRLVAFGRWTDSFSPAATKKLVWAVSSLATSAGFERHARRIQKVGRVVGIRDASELYRSLVGIDVSVAGNGALNVGRHPPDLVESWGRWPGGPVEQAMGVDTLTYLPDDILVKVDRATMARSLEGRMPFLSEPIYRFAWSLPSDLRWNGSQGKAVVRRMLATQLPPEIVNRSKRGFGVPIGEWLRGGLRPWADDLLLSDSLVDAGYVDASLVRSLWQSHLAGRTDRSEVLWPVLVFESWRRMHHPEWSAR